MKSQDNYIVGENGRIYLNQAHKEWSERARKSQEKMNKQHYTMEEVYEQQERLDRQIREYEASRREKYKNLKKKP